MNLQPSVQPWPWTSENNRQHTPSFNWSEHSRVSGTTGTGIYIVILWSWSKISLCIAGGLCLWCVSSDRSLATGQRVVSGWTCYQPVVHLPVRISSCLAHTTPAYVGLASQLTPTQKHTAQHGTLDKQAVLIMENIEYRSLGQCTYVHIGTFETSYQNWGDFGESKNPKIEAHSRKK